MRGYDPTLPLNAAMPTNLRALRKQLCMTQAELAAVLGISRKSIGEYERGQAPTPRQTMLATCALLMWADQTTSRRYRDDLRRDRLIVADVMDQLTNSQEVRHDQQPLHARR